MDTSDIRKNLKIMMDGQPYIVVDFQFVKPGKGQAFTRCKLRNMETGAHALKMKHPIAKGVGLGIMAGGVQTGPSFQTSGLLQSTTTLPAAITKIRPRLCASMMTEADPSPFSVRSLVIGMLRS